MVKNGKMVEPDGGPEMVEMVKSPNQAMRVSINEAINESTNESIKVGANLVIN